MKVFAIRHDVDNYSPINVENRQAFEGQLKFCAKPLVKWDSIPYFYESAELKKGNFSKFCNSALVFDRVAYDALASCLEIAGEITPLGCDGSDSLSLVNILQVCNALDQKNTIREATSDGSLGRLITPVFLPSRLGGSSLFKIPDDEYSKIYTYTETEFLDSGDEFYTRYCSNNLTGLLFDEIWSDVMNV